MTKALITRITKSYGKIYDMGDNGLEYMDKHIALDEVLMEHVYNDTLDTLSNAKLLQLSKILAIIVADMQFDLEAL